MKNDTFKLSTIDITEGGIMVAAALILNFIKIPMGITGGSINLQMLPLIIYSLRKGWFKGFLISGVVYGIVSCVVDTSGNLANFPFDYLIGFGSCSLCGFFSKKILESTPLKTGIFLVISMILVTATRLLGSTLSSMIVYGYTLGPSLVYNVAYIVPSVIFTYLVLIIFLKSLRKLNVKKEH